MLTKNEIRLEIYHILWCDLVIGKFHNNKKEFCDDNVEEYIKKNNKKLEMCVSEVYDNYLEEKKINDSLIQNKLYKYFNTYETLINYNRYSPYKLILDNEDKDEDEDKCSTDLQKAVDLWVDDEYMTPNNSSSIESFTNFSLSFSKISFSK